MAREPLEPSVRESRTGGDAQETFTHPAYGVITITTVTGGDKTLFGSDLGHNQRLCIRIKRAELDRHLCRDWIHSRGDLIEFEMSHAQFAQFITSNGNGSGTPITIKWLETAGEIPGIQNPQTKHETHRQEIRDSVKRANEALSKSIEALEAMVESGKIGKKELRETVRTMRIILENAPANLEFAVKSAEEAFEKAASDAKIEVESYMQMTAQRIGLKHIGELAQIENKESGNE